MEHSKTYAAALEEEPFEQEPESISDTVTDDKHRFFGGSFNNGYVSVGGGATAEIAPPDTLDEEFDLYKDTGFVSAAIHQYADDVTQPGVRVTAKSEETENWFEDEFLPQAGLVGGQRHQEFSQFLYQDVIQYLAAGNILDENVKNGDDKITGFMHINPASCKAMTEPNKPILRAPEATEKDWWGKGDGEYQKTSRGDAAAFVQYHPESVLGQKGMYKDDDRDEIPLSLNDVTYRPRTPPAGKIWGIPIMRNIKEELIEFKNIRRDLARAIRTKAWGIWSVSFDTEVIETKDEVLVEGWEKKEMDNFTEGVGEMEPGQLVGHDGSISFEKMQGDVPEEVLEVLEAYVKLIVSSLPPPLYAVGFEDNINQFVVKEQEEIYESSVESMRTTLSNTWTPTLKQVAKDHGKDPEGLELLIEAPEDSSPIRSMEVDDLEKFALFADGLSNLLGQDAYRAFDPEMFADLVAQLPVDAFKEEAFVGVPNGVPGDVNLLPVLQEMQDKGRISHRGIERIQDRIKEAKDSGDVTTRSLYVSPFAEQTGGDTGSLGGAFGDDNSGGEREAERNPDGTLAGSEPSN